MSMELSRSSSSSNRGFYLRMKLVNRHGKNNKALFYKYFKWVLWISLAFYIFSSYLITSSSSTAKSSSSQSLLDTTTVISTSKASFVPRALFDTTTTMFKRKPRPEQTVLSKASIDMKVYVYDLPSIYNSEWLTDERCSNHLFASEVAIHRALLTSEVRTLDPWLADFFFVPVYATCNFSTQNGFPSTHHARPLLASAVRYISTNMPFWNRSSGQDHVFVASHDYGPCFHSMEEDAIKDGIPTFLKNSIMLQTFGVRFRHPCQAAEHIVIPPYVSPASVRSTIEAPPSSGKRDIPVFFRGKVEVHPKNYSGQIYSKGVRTMIWRKFKRNRKLFYLKRTRVSDYQSEIRRSVFCLCPLGWAPWSPRLVESVALGCVPVIIADGIRLPFSDTVRWSEISLTVLERDVGKLGRILKHVAATNLTTIQRNLWDPVKRRALLFNDVMEPGDATWFPRKKGLIVKVTEFWEWQAGSDGGQLCISCHVCLDGCEAVPILPRGEYSEVALYDWCGRR